LDINTYQKMSKRTLNLSLSHGELQENINLGLIGEVGEVTDIIKKIQYHNHPLTSHSMELEKEIGDIYWYFCAYCTINNIDVPSPCVSSEKVQKTSSYYKLVIDIYNTVYELINYPSEEEECLLILGNLLKTLILKLDLSLDVILENNISKLTKRYPEGFSSEHSLNRA